MFEASKEKITEFQKEVEAKPNLMEGYLFDDGSSQANSFGNDRAAPKKQTEQQLANAALDPAQLSFLQRVENLKPLWHNKELMSPIMVKRAKLEEIK
jgi:hypothetical protein